MSAFNLCQYQETDQRKLLPKLFKGKDLYHYVHAPSPYSAQHLAGGLAHNRSTNISR